MENPTQEIIPIVRALTQGSPNEQQRAVETYFLPNAEFVHPFCRVNSFRSLSIPFLGEYTSRDFILAILRWYRFMSPRIDISFDSVLMDAEKNTMYLAMHQRFALWIIPFYAANVHLVTVLHLVEKNDEEKQDSEKEVPGSGLPSYAQVAGSRQPLLSERRRDPAVTFDPATGVLEEQQQQPKKKYYVAKQEDLYQVNEWIKFLVPFGIGNVFVCGYMLVVTFFCWIAALVTRPIVLLLTAGGRKGNVAPKEGQEKEPGRFAEGAAWTPSTLSPLATAVGLY